MSRKRLHEKIKNFLIGLGQSEGYKAYSGDSEPLDVRIKQRHIEYKPDVIWKTKRGRHYIFEIAFTEDWRAVVGEYTLSWISNSSRYIVFRLVEGKKEQDLEYNLLSNLLGILYEQFKTTTWYFWIITKDEAKNFEMLRKKIKKQLKEWNFIT